VDAEIAKDLGAEADVAPLPRPALRALVPLGLVGGGNPRRAVAAKRSRTLRGAASPKTSSTTDSRTSRTGTSAPSRMSPNTTATWCIGSKGVANEMTRAVPEASVRTSSPTRSTRRSWRWRHAMRSLTEICASPCASAKAATSGPRITVPSSLTSSARTPTSGRSVRVQRSTAASVWPDRMRTPPSRAMSGNTWPGRAKSAAPALGLARARTVLVRSSAEIPVVRPWRTSTDTVNAVDSGASLSATIGARLRRRATARVIGAQTMPEVWRTMNAMR